MAPEPDHEMRASECARKFVILAGGGVRVAWQCGDELTAKSETLCDVELLADKYPAEEHSHRRLGRRRKG